MIRRTNFAQCSTIVVFLHSLVWHDLRLFQPLGLLGFFIAARALCGSAGQVANGVVGFLEFLEARVQLLGPI